MSKRKQYEPNVLVISSPSGGGKTTVCNLLLRRLSTVTRSISYTTRNPRINERNGRDYFFISKEEFRKKIKDGFFIEWAKYSGNYYGTSFKQLSKSPRNRDVILEIEVKGARKVKRTFKEKAVLIFIVPPSLRVLKERLKRRGANSEKDMSRRLKIAAEEIKAARGYDYIVVNKDLQEAVRDIETIVKAARLRVSRKGDLLERFDRELLKG